MSFDPKITAAPAAAARAYAGTAAGASSFGGSAPGIGTDQGFGAALAQALEGAVQTGKSADAQAVQALTGKGSLTDVVAAVTQAQLALQTTVAIRDRVVQAYQTIMQMPI